MTDPADPPIVCDMTDAPDTPEQRLAEHRHLFADALIGREHLDSGANRFRFRADAGIEDRVRSLVAREKACCAFLDFTITADDDEVWWDTATLDDPIAQRILQELYRLPETAGEGVPARFERFDEQGLEIVVDGGGVPRPPDQTPGNPSTSTALV